MRPSQKQITPEQLAFAQVHALVRIVDDEADLREALSFVLDMEGWKTVTYGRAEDFFTGDSPSEPGCVVLDVRMPGMSGIEAQHEMRSRGIALPIIFLTALSDEEDKLLGYELGADDYVTKPFTMSVLYAKTMALIKRNQRNVLAGDRMEVSGITLELTAGRAYAGGKEVFLTPKEFSLLRCLMQNKNLVMSREQLLVKCWGYDYEGESRAVDTHIKRLREKLGDYAECIKTVIKAGYRLEG